MDLIMPVMDGFEATRRLRRVEELKCMKIIAVSASTLIAASHLQTEFGFDDYVPKPLQIHEVFEKLARHLDLEWQYEEKAAQKPSKADLVSPSDIQDIPPPPELEVLYSLTRDGNFTGLRAHLDRLESTESKYEPFTSQIRHLADALDEDAICDLLSHYRGEA
jgi:YesN/AraC family two-component response regulator